MKHSGKTRSGYYSHLILLGLLLLPFIGFAQQKPERLLESFEFTEGPAFNNEGILFFSDVPEEKIFRYNPESGEHSLFLDNTGGANGLYFTAGGKLYACAGKARQVIAIDEEGNKVDVVADHYNGNKLNSPNDLWINKQGGIYFTDPRYGEKDNLEQDGMHVYYIKPGNKKVIRVANDLTRPNGIIGSENGNKIYIVDEGERKTFVYNIKNDNTLTNKQLFCEEGIDGMSITDKGNICITTENGVSVYSPGKKLLASYDFKATPTNVTYRGGNLYVTTQSGELYKVKPDSNL
jgi:gluconolactonase